jgi:hypothetical protein
LVLSVERTSRRRSVRRHRRPIAESVEAPRLSLARARDRIEARSVVPRRRKRSPSERRQSAQRVVGCVVIRI